MLAAVCLFALCGCQKEIKEIRNGHQQNVLAQR
jgi:hypothetical protein